MVVGNHYTIDVREFLELERRVRHTLGTNPLRRAASLRENGIEEHSSSPTLGPRERGELDEEASMAQPRSLHIGLPRFLILRRSARSESPVGRDDLRQLLWRWNLPASPIVSTSSWICAAGYTHRLTRPVLVRVQERGRGDRYGLERLPWVDVPSALLVVRWGRSVWVDGLRTRDSDESWCYHRCEARTRQSREAEHAEETRAAARFGLTSLLPPTPLQNVSPTAASS